MEAGLALRAALEKLAVLYRLDLNELGRYTHRMAAGSRPDCWGARWLGTHSAPRWQLTHLSLCPPRAAVRQRSTPICLQLLIADTGLVVFEILPPLCADDVGHFDGRPRHGRSGR